MSGKTTIEWTDNQWNPVSGCTKISPGCANCYAEAQAERWRGSAGFPKGFDFTYRPHLLNKPREWKEPRMVFVNSMSDLFHEEIDPDFLARVWQVMEETPRHTYQILTKRAERMMEFCQGKTIPGHIWLGVSVESQAWVKRVDILRQIPAKIRFLSCEPLLGPLSLDLTGIHWVIVGGESGRSPRPIDPDWVRSLRNQCHVANVAFFFKQWGGRNKKKAGNLLDGKTYMEFPQHFDL